MTTLQELLDKQYLNISDKGSIKKIELENKGSPTGALDLREFTNLETLKLYGDGINDANYFSIIQSIPNKEKIKALGFSNNPIKNPRFDYVGDNFPNLEWLSLGGGNPIDPNTSLKGLGKLTKLKDFYLGADINTVYPDMNLLPASITNYNEKGASYLNNLKNQVKLDKDIKVKPLLKDIPESGYDKIIFVDNKKLDQGGYLLEWTVGPAWVDDNNPKLFLSLEGAPQAGLKRIASEEALSDLKRFFPDINPNFVSFPPGGGQANVKFQDLNTDPNSGIYCYKYATMVAWGNFTTGKAYYPHTFINKEKNINIQTMQPDNAFFTFVRSDDGSGFKRGKIRNLEAFKFLQKYAGDYSFEVIYPQGESFNVNELPQSVRDQLPKPAKPLPQPAQPGPSLEDKIKNLEAEKQKLKEIIQKAGVNPDDSNADQQMEDLKNRPTKEQLNQAVQAKEEEFKDFINPSDKDEIQAAAEKQGMVSKENYDKVVKERDARPDTTLTDYQNLKDNQEKHTEKDLEHHKPEDLKPADLPDNWKTELARIPDLEKRPTQDVLDSAIKDKDDWKKKYDDSEKDKEAFKRYIQGRLDAKDKEIKELKEKLQKVADNLGTNSTDPNLVQKVGDLVKEKGSLNDQVKQKNTEIGQLKDRIKQLETQKPASTVPTTSKPSGGKDTVALQAQKQAKEDELQKVLSGLKTKLGSDYPEVDINELLQAESKLVQAGRSESDTQSDEYREWKAKADDLVGGGYLAQVEVKKISDLQAEITKLEMQLSQQPTAQVQVPNKS
ncbi:MAG: hypothetical protein I3270_01875 [Candidatus Moeniiplasma glomeromycotorum]|nr:hypothetical protein [Candidatus Moeniiplasma glomeromycotorum]MCE8162450.1 hypothetical protein [Candidatus Moeniiplasma glomeromycotorum]MCE8166376.1 hypothetical protein [Candidatus Moeniiplasma glomeromycotorum]MCE8166858.1 hypothetical protein [Candidatus Moeniiplasma glomeromycotorum]